MLLIAVVAERDHLAARPALDPQLRHLDAEQAPVDLGVHVEHVGGTTVRDEAEPLLVGAVRAAEGDEAPAKVV